ncbi:MAG: EF-hand domain-containing protein [Candidatus Melainabacteria bacterium]|nr:EF-hand domain-containing protein [Candidatus Melainabacteria bacterium]
MSSSEPRYYFSLSTAEASTHRRDTGGLCIAGTFDEIKQFAFDSFNRLDKNGDGFICRTELRQAFDDPHTDYKSRSYIFFLLRRIDEIQAAYDEEWSDKDGISRADIQEYFTNWILKTRSKQSV